MADAGRSALKSAGLGIGLIGFGLVGGCTTVGPDYAAVPVELPATWSAPVPAVFQGGVVQEPWWLVFDDPALAGLIDRGLEQNLDLRVALSRWREAQAVARGVIAATGPQVGVDSQAAASEAFGGDADDRGGSLLLDAALDGVLPVDLFGGLQRTREAALARAGQQERLVAEAARLTTAAIGSTYIQLRGSQRLLALTEELLELQRRTLELVRQRVASGLAPGLDEVRAAAAVATLAADLGPLRSDVARQRQALAVLLAEPPGTLVDELQERAPIPDAGTGASIGVPADLLRRRPDVQAAELAILANTAEVGVETADLYPQLTLPGSIVLGPLGVGPEDLAAGVIASISALLQYPLYDGGQRRADVDAAEERLLQSTLIYRDTVLQAAQEVEQALLAYEGSRDRRDALQTAVARNRTAYRQSEQLYRDGFASFIDVLDSQRELNSSLQELALAEQNLALAVVDLYSALGGSPAGT